MINETQQDKCLRDFVCRIERAIHLKVPDFLTQLGAILQEGSPLLNELTDAQRAGSPARYERNLLYADPVGRFVVLALTWRQGQFTPIHGHWTWCGYSVLDGKLEEEEFEWIAATQVAQFTQRAERQSGAKAVTSPAGLADIHRLGNANSKTAISLHVYGVDARSIATHVNRVVCEQREADSRRSDALKPRTI